MSARVEEDPAALRAALEEEREKLLRKKEMLTAKLVSLKCDLAESTVSGAPS